MNIRKSTLQDLSLIHILPALSVLEPGKLILEVKFTEMLPQLLRDVLPPPAAEFTAVSKYVLCYEKTRYMNGFEYWYET